MDLNKVVENLKVEYPELKFEAKDSIILINDKPINLKYNYNAELLLNKEHGIILEEEIVKKFIKELKHD